MKFLLQPSSRPLAALLVAGVATAQTTYDGCDVDTYYSSLSTDPTTWTREDLSALLASTHRKILPIQEEGADDLYDALIDLFPGQGDDPNSTVQLAFRDIPFPIFPFANSQTWQRANLWPEERISSTITDAGAKTDVHSNVPADSTVFADKGRLFYGECGLFESEDLCQPLPETALTMTDGKIWQSPEVNRGVHARSILYMATRYFNIKDSTTSTEREATTTSSLELADCPPFANADVFGYLSILLEWHASYPPTDAEIQRNSRMCERWQGNRNPFVDYPQIASAIFGQPDTLKSGYRQYESCFVGGGNKVETSSPTATPNACQSLQAGDIQIIMANADDPNQIAFFTLDEIPASVGSIYVTDRPWDGSQLLENGEGTVSFAVPESTTDSVGRTCNGLCPGYVYGFGFGNDKVVWTNDSAFDLGISGDTLLTYCLSADGNPIFLHGLSYADGGWANASLTADEYGLERSAVPAELVQFGYGSVELPYVQNNVYNGTSQGLVKRELLTEFANATNYMGSNEIRYEIPQLDGPATSSGGMPSASRITVAVVAAATAMAVAGSVFYM